MTKDRDIGHSVHIGGSVRGQVSVGNRNVQYWHQVRASGPATAEDLAELRAEFAKLRADLPQDSGQTSDQAAAKLRELEEALNDEQVDLPTVEHVQGWFRRRLPQFTSAINKIIIGPIVAKLVAAGGDTLAAEFARRFG